MPPTTCAALTSIVLIATTFCATAWSQPGTILSHTKVNSDTLAALGAPLANGDEFGDAVAALGDLDGPGPSVAALAVGAIGDDDGGSHRGAVYILFLDQAGHPLSRQKISDTQGNFTAPLVDHDEFGSSVAYLGDLDGPGPSVAALAVGAVGDADGGPGRGAVYVLLLGASGSVLSHQKISDTQGNFTAILDDDDEFGGAVAGLGDLDGPGPSAGALAVGAIGDDDGAVDQGAAYILFLNGAGGVVSHQKISDTAGGFTATFKTGDDFGEDVASLGDLDGPGPSVRALAVSAIKRDDGGNGRGAVYVLFLAGTGMVLSHQTISGTQGNFAGPLANEDNFGTAITALGDLDGPGPGVAAIAVSAGSDDGAGMDRGAVYILFLTATGSVLSYLEHSSTAGYFTGQLTDLDEFGSALTALGDLDGGGPGAQTLVAGVGYDDHGGTDRGAAYLMSLAGGAAVAGVEPAAGTPGNGLGAVWPNPSLRGASIAFRASVPGRVRIDLTDVGGRRVRGLVDEHVSAGEYRIAWDGTDDSGRPVAAGIYFVGMSLDGRTVGARARTVLLR